MWRRLSNEFLQLKYLLKCSKSNILNKRSVKKLIEISKCSYNESSNYVAGVVLREMAGELSPLPKSQGSSTGSPLPKSQGSSTGSTSPLPKSQGSSTGSTGSDKRVTVQLPSQQEEIVADMLEYSNSNNGKNRLFSIRLL